MNATKKYLKILTMGVFMVSFMISFISASFLGFISFINLMIAKNITDTLWGLLAAVLLGLLAALLWDILSFLDKKFKPY